MHELFPAALIPTIFSIALGIVVLVSNNTRPITRCWALLLFALALWQGFIALAQLQIYPQVLWLRLAAISGGLAIFVGWLLTEAISTPWRSFTSNIYELKPHILILLLFGMAFSDSYIPETSNAIARIRGPLYWVLGAIALSWSIALLLTAVLRSRRAQLLGTSRREIAAFAISFGFNICSLLMSFIFGSILKIHEFPWLASTMFILGQTFLTILLIRGDIWDFIDFKKALLKIGVIMGSYLVFALILTLVKYRITAIDGYFWLCLGLAVIIIAAAVHFDRWIKIRLETAFFSPTRGNMKAMINKLTECATDWSELHTNYVQSLKDWTNGSVGVFLSGGGFAPAWPLHAMPKDFIDQSTEVGWATPEMLERAGLRASEGMSFLISNEIGAIVIHQSGVGEKLIAAFGSRKSGTPFVTRELREAREYLSIMQLGLSLVKLRQRVRGSDRLNFYAQHAPQFAHELRNGLYFQSVLLKAVVNGDTNGIQKTDAIRGLEQVAQVDRLCEHFFTIGNLYKRPITEEAALNCIQEVLANIKGQLAYKADRVVHNDLMITSSLRILVNRDLLQMALFNLIRNVIDCDGGATLVYNVKVSAIKNIDRLHVLVEDNGPGLPRERQRDPFVPSIRRKKGGMGLGLSIVRDCVEAMGGSIGVRSSNELGTCFEIALICSEGQELERV